MSEKLRRIYSTISEEESKLERIMSALAQTITLKDVIEATEGYDIVERVAQRFEKGKSIDFYIEEGRWNITTAPKSTIISSRGYCLREFRGGEAENYYKKLESEILDAQERELENLPF